MFSLHQVFTSDCLLYTKKCNSNLSFYWFSSRDYEIERIKSVVIGVHRELYEVIKSFFVTLANNLLPPPLEIAPESVTLNLRNKNTEPTK